MKFGKSLSNQIEETLPGWRDKFLSYKDLKKRLKLMEPKGEGESPVKRQRVEGGRADSAGEEGGMTKEEVEFINLLEEEMEKFNAFFMEQEEEYIIRLKELQDRVGRVKDSTEEMINIRKEIVDFHGEMVLLENYSALNYTGLVKILKKYDKRTGALIRMPFIQKVLQQPFFTTDLLYQLVKECEKMLDHLFPAKDIPTSSSEAAKPTLANDPTTSAASAKVDITPGEINDGVIQIPKELAEIEHMKNMYMKSTLSALRVLKEIRRGSSTVSHFSLPPLQSSGVEESWNKKVPVLEQEAK